MELKALPIGFRFHPTDEELVRHYLKGKITGQIKSEAEVIPEIEVCKCEPWDLPDKSLIRSDDPEWFFFAPKEHKYRNGSSSHRATEAGYWKATGKDRVIKSKGEKQQQQHIIGKKKTLAFHCGRAPKGLRTRWFMHEYRTTEPEFFSGEQGGYVLCRLFKKQEENNERSSPEEMDRSGYSPTPSRSIPDNMEAKEEANTPLIKESPVSALHASPVDLPGPIETQAAPITRWLADRTDNLVTNEANTSLMPLHGHVDGGAKVGPSVGSLVQYEQERDARIRENMERMQKLGILDLAHHFNQSTTVGSGSGSGRGGWRRKLETPGSAGASRTKPASPSPVRRSLRLKSLDPVSYCETHTKKDKDLEGGSSDLIEEGSKEEVYTEEHEKLLGTCDAPWTLFVDGYGQDGKRIYDQVRGQTCHQCRQKTLGHHTSCYKCQIVQGQFCGDCLYMSYGENVLEAKKNPNWTCPVCRGICNCSICRTKKGWFPTPPGCVYRKVVSLGYKSVAHYLIGTRRSSANSADSSSADSSNKLASTKSEASSISEHAPVAKQGLEDVEMSSKINQNEGTDHQVKNPADGYKDDSRSESVVTSDSLDCQAKNQDVGCVTPSKPAPKKRKLIERSPDCVASRLRSRSNKS